MVALRDRTQGASVGHPAREEEAAPSMSSEAVCAGVFGLEPKRVEHPEAATPDLELVSFCSKLHRVMQSLKWLVGYR
jgi:hypothetical protein